MINAGIFATTREALAGVLLTALMAAMLLYAGFFAYVNIEINKDTFYDGIVIDDVDLSGLTREQAMQSLEAKKYDRDEVIAVTIRYDGSAYTVTGKELGVSHNLDKVVEDAWLRCRSGRFLERFDGIVRLRAGKEAPLKSSNVYNRETVDTFAKDFAARFYRASADATMSYENGSFIFIDEVVGSAIDDKALADDIWRCLEGEGEMVQARVDAVEPLISRSMLEKSTRKLAQVKTKIPENEGRSANIETASKALSGRIILPDEEFSINKATGERTEEKGYKRVPLTGQNDDNGIGQFASTFYRCALLAGMDVVERNRQAAPVSYLPIGFDAAVEWGGKDLIMKNTTDAVLYLYTTVENGDLNMVLYGMVRDDGASVKLTGEVVETVQPPEVVVIYDAVMPAGQTKTEVEPRIGYRVNTYRQFLTGNEIKREEKLSSDYYPAVRGRVRIGTFK